jgi:hypothetical protein
MQSLNVRRRSVWAPLPWCFMLLSAAPLALQAQQGKPAPDTTYGARPSAHSGCEKAPDWLRCGQLPRLTRDSAKQLLSNLDTVDVDRWPELMRVYFGDLYSPSFTDWVVFISRKGKIKEALISDGKFRGNSIVRGKQYIHALVFADTSLEDPPTDKSLADAAKERARHLEPTALHCRELGLRCTVALTSSGEDAPAGTSPGGALIARRTTLIYTREPALAAFVQGITKGVLGGAGTSPTAVPDSSIAFNLENIVDDSIPRLYAGQVRFVLPENAVARFSLRANDGYYLPHSQGVFRSVANGSGRRFGASLAMGVTWNAPDTTFSLTADSNKLAKPDSALTITSRSSPVRPNLWVLAHLALWPALLPQRRVSLSATVGTNVGVSDLFRDLLVGLSLDRLVSKDIGVVGGVNFIERTTARPSDPAKGVFTKSTTRSYRKGEPFAGVTFSF